MRKKYIDLHDKAILRTIILGILVIVFFVSIVFIYYNMIYEEKRTNIIKDGRMDASYSADQFDRYLSTNIDLIKFTAYTLDEMIAEKKSDQEIQDFLVGQSTAIRNAVLENSTGLYGYINGRFFSGTNWEPPTDYDATARPWYTKPMSHPGQLTILEPYVDVQSGNTMLALGKSLCDGVSVISVDISLDQMQKLTEEAVLDGGSDVEMILTPDGRVVTHSDINEVGKNYSEEKTTLGARIFERLNGGHESYFEFDHERKHYIVYDARFEGGWHCVSVHDATKVFSSLTLIFVRTILVVILIVLILGIMLTVSGKRAVTARQALAENEAKTVFLSNMSHEIRTPINAVLGMNEMILRECRDKNILGYSEKIETAGKDLLKLVNELLEFTGTGPGNASARKRERFVAPGADVLAVDDTPMNLEVLKSLLKRTLVNIDTAGSGDEGLELSGKKKYDLIFLDHMMPDKDGIETLHELRARKDDLNKDTPVVCITANVIKGSKEMYISEGFDDLMTKPLNAGHLEEILLKYLPQGKISYDVPNEADWDGEDSAVIPDELKPLTGNRSIDINAGIKNSGSVKSYLPLLKIFYSSMDEKREELNRYLSEGDIKNYTIKIHALKSSARIIGASALGDEAEALEAAGKAGDMEHIKKHHGNFLADYEALRDPLSEIFKEDEVDTDKPEADEDLLRDVFKELRNAADDMDCDRLQTIFEEMEAYRIPDKVRTLYKSLKEESGNYDYDSIMELIDNAQVLGRTGNGSEE